MGILFKFRANVQINVKNNKYKYWTINNYKVLNNNKQLNDKKITKSMMQKAIIALYVIVFNKLLNSFIAKKYSPFLYFV